ncbi:MAG: helix-turn-helix transcriptional regulator [Bacteriovoracaceae bacterium]|nr:helix-turn-helix transcriptional regulator [Bacteriovoracaceae bacterium]
MKEMRRVLENLLGEDLSSGEVLKGLRINKNLSQDELAELTGIQRTNLSALENDRTPMTSYYAEIFSAVFKVHPSEILYPNGYVKKSDDVLKLEKKAESYFKKMSG